MRQTRTQRPQLMQRLGSRMMKSWRKSAGVVVGLAAVEAVLEDLVLDAVALQVALAAGRAVAVEAQLGAAHGLVLAEAELDLLEVGLRAPRAPAWASRPAGSGCVTSVVMSMNTGGISAMRAMRGSRSVFAVSASKNGVRLELGERLLETSAMSAPRR